MSDTTALQLRLRHDGIHVCVEWLEACGQYIRTQVESGLTNARLYHLIVEQWLLSNLSDVGEPCIAQELLTSPSTSLQTTLSLQVNTVVDVSKPLYSQLRHIAENDDSENDTDTGQEQAWESRGSKARMLVLELTDGVRVVKGMEYRPITSLHLSTTQPGSKLRLHPPIESRQGVLFLTPQNTTFLGGAVEDLKERNAHDRVIRRRLNISSSPLPVNENIPPPTATLPLPPPPRTSSSVTTTPPSDDVIMTSAEDDIIDLLSDADQNMDDDDDDELLLQLVGQ